MNRAIMETVIGVPAYRRKPYIVRNQWGHGLDEYKVVKAGLDAGAELIYNVAFVGDSIGEGYHADEVSYNVVENGCVGLLNAAFISRWQDTGLGFIPAAQGGGGGSHWSFDGYWYNHEAGFGIGSANRFAETAGAVGEFSFKGTGVVLNCVRGTVGGTINIEIDSIGYDPISLYNGTLDDHDFVIAAAGTLADTTHTLKMTTANSTGVMLNGAYALTGATKGLRMIRSSISESKAVSFTWSGYSVPCSINQWTPILTIIALIANDAAISTIVADYKTQIQTLITAGAASGSVLLYADFPRPDLPPDANDPYLAALQELSDENDIPLIDCITPLKGKVDAMGCIASDALHPNAKAHRQLLYVPLEKVLL